MGIAEFGLFYNTGTGKWDRRPPPAMDAERRPAVDNTALIIGVGPGVWDDLDELVDARGVLERAALLFGGTREGLPTVEVLVRTTSGELIHANTTWRLWEQATCAFGDEVAKRAARG